MKLFITLVRPLDSSNVTHCDSLKDEGHCQLSVHIPDGLFWIEVKILKVYEKILRVLREELR